MWISKVQERNFFALAPKFRATNETKLVVIMEGLGAGDLPVPPLSQLAGSNASNLPSIGVDNPRPIAPPFPGGIGGLKLGGLGEIITLYCTLNHSLIHA